MSYAGPIALFNVDYNSWRPDTRRVGALLWHSDQPAQTQLQPPAVGDVVVLRNDDGVPDCWAIVVCRRGNWIEFETDAFLSEFRPDGGEDRP